MRRAPWIIGLGIVAHGFLTPYVVAQGVVQSEIVVPTFNVFSMGTTISVPDRGYTSLGGASQASDVRNEFGPGFGRGMSSRRNASDAGARVWIHDFQEMEQALARGRAGDNNKPVEGFAARMHQYSTTPQQPKEPKEAVREVRVAKANTDAESDAAFKLSHAADLLKRGQEAEDRGKLKVASLYYKSVMSLGATPSAPVARQRLASLESKLASR